MPTTASGIPYLDGTEDVKDYPTTSEELATILEARHGAFVTALPATPDDYEEVVLVDSLAAPTYAWRMKYLPTAAKWIYIGGAPATALVDTDEAANLNGAWGNLATVGPDVIVPAAGDYFVRWSVNVGLTTSGSSNGFYLGVAIGNTNPGETYKVAQTTTTQPLSLTGRKKFTGLAAGNTIRLRYQTNNATGSFAHRWLEVTPVALTS